MGIAGEVVLRQRPIEALGACGLLGPGRPVEHRHSLPPARIPLPPLATGRMFLEQWQSRELPDQDLWMQDHYDSVAPAIFVLHDVIVHSSAGILAVGGQVIAETLAFTEPGRHRYRGLAKGIALSRGRVRHLAGAHISLLTGGQENYFHSTLMSLARLSAVPENYRAAAAGLLVPQDAARHGEILPLLDLMPSLAVQEIGDMDTVRVDTLILPLSVCGESAYHPCVAEYFRTVSTSVPRTGARLPRRVYLGRSGTARRRLENEREVMAALGAQGFVAVRPELMSIPDQIRLFREAEAIVAPHGAALANLGYCRPGCTVIELQMDAYVDWRYRHLAALMQLEYDCVLGRARRPWRELGPGFDAQSWEISAHHVAAAVARSVEMTRAAA